MEHVEEIITYSEIRKFCECPMKHHYAYVELLRPALVTPALNKGRLFHEGAAEWLRTSDLDIALAMVDAKSAEYIEEIEDEGAIITPEREDKMRLDKNVVRAMLTGAVRKFEPDVPKITAVETEFSFKFGGVTIAGKIDFVGVDKFNQPFVGEWKTTSDGVETFKNKLMLEWQTIFYAWAWERFTGQRIDTALFLLIRTTSSKPHGEESTEQYHARLDELGCEFGYVVPREVGSEHPKEKGELRAQYCNRLKHYGFKLERKVLPSVSEEYPRQPETWKQYEKRALGLYEDDEMFGMEPVPIDRDLMAEHEEQLPVIINGILADRSHHCYNTMACSMCSYKSKCMKMNDVEFVKKERKHSELS